MWAHMKNPERVFTIYELGNLTLAALTTHGQQECQNGCPCHCTLVVEPSMIHLIIPSVDIPR
jgi:hypothetical protein